MLPIYSVVHAIFLLKILHRSSPSHLRQDKAQTVRRPGASWPGAPAPSPPFCSSNPFRGAQWLHDPPASSGLFPFPRSTPGPHVQPISQSASNPSTPTFRPPRLCPAKGCSAPQPPAPHFHGPSVRPPPASPAERPPTRTPRAEPAGSASSTGASACGPGHGNACARTLAALGTGALGLAAWCWARRPSRPLLSY